MRGIMLQWTSVRGTNNFTGNSAQEKGGGVYAEYDMMRQLARAGRRALCQKEVADLQPLLLHEIVPPLLCLLSLEHTYHSTCFLHEASEI